MPPRSQPYRIEWPLTPAAMEAIDESFQILFDDVRNDSIFPSTTEGDILYRDDKALIRLGIGAANTVLRTDGTVPEWDKVTLTTDVTGILPIANGGTNASSWTAGSVIFAGSGGTSLIQDNANLFWDNVNKRFGIGTASPQRRLDLSTAAGSMTFGDDVTVDNERGIFWHAGAGSSSTGYGLFRPPGIWTDPYVPLNIVWQTGIKLDPGDSSTTGSNVQIPRGGLNIGTFASPPTNGLLVSANVGIGTTVLPGAGSAGLVFGDGTALATMGLNTAGLYADDVGGTVEMFGINEANIVSQLTGLNIRKTADESVTSVTQQADDHLTVNLAASSSYSFEIHGHWTAAAGTPGIAVQLDGTVGISSLKADVIHYDHSADVFIIARITAFNSPVGRDDTGDNSFIIQGTIETSTAGTMFLEWAQNTGDAVNATTLQENSSFTLRKLNA